VDGVRLVTTDVDLAVVGGGIIGCFAAHLGARDGRVALFDRGELGAGATRWSAGVSFPLAATDAHRELVRVSAEHYGPLLGSPFVRPVSMVHVVSDPAAFATRVVGALRPVTGAERDRVHRMLPDVRIGPDEHLLTHDGHGFAVDAAGLARQLADDEAVTAHTGHEVTAVHPDGAGHRLVAGGTEWSARRVVVATGPWPVPRSLPDPRPVRTKRVASLLADLPTGQDDPLVHFVDDDLFFLPRPGGPTVVSFYREMWDVDPDALTGLPDADDLRAGTEAIRRRSPAAADAVTGGRVFCDGYAPDRLPLVTRLAEGVVSVRGGSGSGVRLAPALAAAALRAIDSPLPVHP
jgi:D-arginine dehydrogenase